VSTAEGRPAGALLPPGAPLAFHLLAKLTGAICNLDCTYCFFLSKDTLYPGSRFRMADDLVAAPRQTEFGLAKRASLSKFCRECGVRFACHGGCPKDRFTLAPDGEPGLHYLCPSYKAFFGHIRPAMEAMCRLLQAGQPPLRITARYAGAGRQAWRQRVVHLRLRPQMETLSWQLTQPAGRYSARWSPGLARSGSGKVIIWLHVIRVMDIAPGRDVMQGRIHLERLWHRLILGEASKRGHAPEPRNSSVFGQYHPNRVTKIPLQRRTLQYRASGN
jgi:radical SAM protein with 4Fe4S-binding SPASM domain